MTRCHSSIPAAKTLPCAMFARLRVAICCAGLIWMLHSIPAKAQVNTGTLSGQVTDASGAVVQGATLTVKDEATGYSRVVKSSIDGNYFFPDLPIGQYELTVEAGALKTRKKPRSSVWVSVRVPTYICGWGRRTRPSRSPRAPADLSRDDASISTLVTQDTIADTPLFLRNWDDLLRTVPGVQINRYTKQSGATSAGRTGDFNVNGVHTLQNNFILDGIDNNTFSENVQELSTEAAHPSVDVISEFNVITNPYSAEYGRASWCRRLRQHPQRHERVPRHRL